MEDLSHWDAVEDFSAGEAAALIAGVDPAAPGAPLHKAAPAHKRLKEGHRIARAFVTAPPLTPDEFRFLRAHPLWAHALMSVLFDCYPMLHKEPWPGDPDRPFELPRRFAGPDGDFEKQRFARAEIHRWLGAVGLKSAYTFELQKEVGLPTAPADGNVSGEAAPGPKPAPLTTKEIAHCFDGLRGWDVTKWMAALSKVSATRWLQACVHTPGLQGKSSTLWDPVKIGAALVRNDDAQSRSVRARFQSQPSLKGWREVWKDYEADHIDTL